MLPVPSSLYRLLSPVTGQLTVWLAALPGGRAGEVKHKGHNVRHGAFYCAAHNPALWQ